MAIEAAVLGGGGNLHAPPSTAPVPLEGVLSTTPLPATAGAPLALIACSPVFREPRARTNCSTCMLSYYLVGVIIHVLNFCCSYGTVTRRRGPANHYYKSGGRECGCNCTGLVPLLPSPIRSQCHVKSSIDKGHKRYRRRPSKRYLIHATKSKSLSPTTSSISSPSPALFPSPAQPIRQKLNSKTNKEREREKERGKRETH